MPLSDVDAARADATRSSGGGVVVSLGSLGLTAVPGEAAFRYVPLFWSGCFWIAALAMWRLVYHRAK